MGVQKPLNTTYLCDYQPPDYRVDFVELYFDLQNKKTLVRSKLSIRKFQKASQRPLRLNGKGLKLDSILLDGVCLSPQEYSFDNEDLILTGVPNNFNLTIKTELNPQANNSLSGLYLSSKTMCTQCEAEGFQRITYMLDRPDVMARYKVTIVADKKHYPILLSNGNKCAQGNLNSDRHWVRWEDPFPKPTYLFALVAGDFVCIEDQFITQGKRRVKLKIYVHAHHQDKCSYAMQSLIKAMQWDEKNYGREYDLDLYMIVAVDDFNMGAMENKGLNIFNSKYILAKPETATDDDYEAIENVIGHEYFHNWSGNRITCRDWFQLSLKEGFTVFRDQEFSAAMTSRGVKRIQDVNILRTYQFSEDSSMMAHPVRPNNYVEIDNFYTVTIYNKGAEIIRMFSLLLGAKNFRKACDLYFDRYDGQAVTINDFVRTLEEVGQTDLSGFSLWYSQAGTPRVNISSCYHTETQTYTLTVTQHCPSTPGQKHKKPLPIPIRVGLLDHRGKDMLLQLRNEARKNENTCLLLLTEAKQIFVFENVKQRPVFSAFRGFSAPVKIEVDLNDSDLCFLMQHDSDDFNRWDAGQQFSMRILTQLVEDIHNNRLLQVPHSFLKACKGILLSHHMSDQTLITEMMRLPSESYISQHISPIDPIAIHKAWCFMRQTLAGYLKSTLLDLYKLFLKDSGNSINQVLIKQRRLKNVCLGYLMELDDPSVLASCYLQFCHGNNMTDELAALSCLSHKDCSEMEVSLAEFYQRWKHEALVVNKWLRIQAVSRLPKALGKIKILIKHEAFSFKNPNKVYALIASFAQKNHAQFHDRQGEGYAFLTEIILRLDPVNSHISSSLVKSYTLWRKYDLARQNLLKKQLEIILHTPNLSIQVKEIISKSLEETEEKQ